MKKILFFIVLWACCTFSGIAQLKLENTGKISVGKLHSLDNGRLKIGNDGVAQGLSFYDLNTVGTDFRIYRMSNVAYLTRGGDHGVGIRINAAGYAAIGRHPVSNSYTDFSGQFSVYATDESAIQAKTGHSFDYGDAVKSTVYRPLTVTFAGTYDGNKTFYALGNGDTYSHGSLITSDLSTKENVSTITNPLKKVLNLRGVTFDSKFSNKENILVNPNATVGDEDYISPDIVEQINAEKDRKRLGVIAQEVEAVVPEAVRTTYIGLKAVAYPELVGLLIEAIKEQQTQILELQTEVGILKKIILPDASLRSVTGETETTDIVNQVVASCKLYQNAPNPFSERTIIYYELSETVKIADIYIFNMQGGIVKKIVADRSGRMEIQGSELQAGMYLYSLIADGKEVDTKRMILTR